MENKELIFWKGTEGLYLTDSMKFNYNAIYNKWIVTLNFDIRDAISNKIYRKFRINLPIKIRKIPLFAAKYSSIEVKEFLKDNYPQIYQDILFRENILKNENNVEIRPFLREDDNDYIRLDKNSNLHGNFKFNGQNYGQISVNNFDIVIWGNDDLGLIFSKKDNNAEKEIKKELEYLQKLHSTIGISTKYDLVEIAGWNYL